ncbi:MAG: phosphatidate cytidylyltransferase [Hyphomicrobiales bacterium]
MTAGNTGQAHLKRWITGLLALPVLIACVIAGGAAFSLLVGAAGVACLWEYFRIVTPPGRRMHLQPMLLVGYLASLALILCAHTGRAEMILAVLSINLVVCGLLSLLRFATDRAVLDGVARQIQGICYIPLSLSLLVLLRSAPGGTVWIFLLCAIIFAGDTAAFYGGTLWGRHKLSPAISPGKTVEGAIAGLGANLAVGAAGKFILQPDAGWAACLIFSAAVGLAGQVGDLFESELKRAANIKDSGGLLPGHGGILDRIDALLFAAPVAFGLRLVIG